MAGIQVTIDRDEVQGLLESDDGLACLVGAVDALAARAESSGGTRRGFIEFVVRRVRPAHSPADLERMLTYLWRNVRSAHFHSGSFPLGGVLGRSLELISPEHMDAMEIQSAGHWVLRSAILVWIVRDFLPNA